MFKINMERGHIRGSKGKSGRRGSKKRLCALINLDNFGKLLHEMILQGSRTCITEFRGQAMLRWTIVLPSRNFTETQFIENHRLTPNFFEIHIFFNTSWFWFHWSFHCCNGCTFLLLNCNYFQVGYQCIIISYVCNVHVYAYMYKYMYVCAHVCVCESIIVILRIYVDHRFDVFLYAVCLGSLAFPQYFLNCILEGVFSVLFKNPNPLLPLAIWLIPFSFTPNTLSTA